MCCAGGWPGRPDAAFHRRDPGCGAGQRHLAGWKRPGRLQDDSVCGVQQRKQKPGLLREIHF